MRRAIMSKPFETLDFQARQQPVDATAAFQAQLLQFQERPTTPATDRTGGSDKAEEKTAKDVQAEAEKAIKALKDAVEKGEWSDEAKKVWQKVVDEQKNLAGATPKSVARALNAIGAAMNAEAKKNGWKFEVGMGVTSNNGKSEFWMTLKGPGIDKADNLKAILGGKDSKTAIKVGDMKE